MAGFQEILGNDLMKRQFLEAMHHDAVSHAYLLIGEKGIGKKTTAEGFALNLLCQNKTEEGLACLSCASCKKILAHNHPDVIWVEHEKPDSIHVREIREQVNDTVAVRPYAGTHKVYIIKDAEKMTPQAQNALLKTLEEPPAYAVFLLLANEEKGLLETILSRTVKFKLKPCTDSQIRQYLQSHFQEDEERIDIAVAFSGGNIGKAVKLLSSETFTVWYHKLIKLCRSIKRLDSAEIAFAAKEFAGECEELDDVLDLIQLWYRDLMMYKVTKDMNGLSFAGERKALMDLASISSYEGIEEIMDAVENCRRRLRANVNAELALELLFLNMKEK